MTTLLILRALLYHIGSEASPAYRLPAPTARRGPLSGVPNFSLVLLGLLLAGPLLLLLDQATGGTLATRRDEVLILAAIVAVLLFSLSWIAPTAALAGQEIARERADRTWNLLITTPRGPGEMTLVKAAAALGQLWPFILGMVLLSVLVGVVVGVLAVGVIRFADLAPSVSPAGPMLALFFSGVLIVGSIVVERAQEVVLAVLIGMIVGKTARQFWSFIALVGGLMIRLVPLLILFALVRSSDGLLPLAAQLYPLLDFGPGRFELLIFGLGTLLILLCGPVALIIIIPGLPAVLLALAALVVREAIIRGLYRVAVQADS